jgi:hypothetical protein
MNGDATLDDLKYARDLLVASLRYRDPRRLDRVLDALGLAAIEHAVVFRPGSEPGSWLIGPSDAPRVYRHVLPALRACHAAIAAAGEPVPIIGFTSACQRPENALRNAIRDRAARWVESRSIVLAAAFRHIRVARGVMTYNHLPGAPRILTG